MFPLRLSRLLHTYRRGRKADGSDHTIVIENRSGDACDSQIGLVFFESDPFRLDLLEYAFDLGRVDNGVRRSLFDRGMSQQELLTVFREEGGNRTSQSSAETWVTHLGGDASSQRLLCFNHMQIVDLFESQYPQD